MPKERIYDVLFVCRFCGASYTDKWFDEREKYFLNMCQKCSISVSAKKGKKIRYGAAVRDLSNAAYSDTVLKRGEIYTVQRTKQWHHGCHLWLQETGNTSFDLKMFTPVEYEKHTEMAHAYAAFPAGFFGLDAEKDLIADGDLVWNTESRIFEMPGESLLGFSASWVLLVVRPNPHLRITKKCEKCGRDGCQAMRDGEVLPCVYCLPNELKIINEALR